MTERETGARSLDLTGEVCPMAFVRAKLHLDAMAADEALTLVLKAGEQVRDVPRSLREEGHRIETVRREGDFYHFLVRKGE